MDERERGELEKYYEARRLLIDREIDELLTRFGGLVSMTDLPVALFVVDTRHEDTAVRESAAVAHSGSLGLRARIVILRSCSIRFRQTTRRPKCALSVRENC